MEGLGGAEEDEEDATLVKSLSLESGVRSPYSKIRSCYFLLCEVLFFREDLEVWYR